MRVPPRRHRFFLQVLWRRPSLLVCHVGDRVGRVVERTLASRGIDSREFAVLSLLSLARAPMVHTLHVTPYEERFRKKRKPIYYFELRRRAEGTDAVGDHRRGGGRAQVAR